jgi:hypothetical protein
VLSAHQNGSGRPGVEGVKLGSQTLLLVMYERVHSESGTRIGFDIERPVPVKGHISRFRSLRSLRVLWSASPLHACIGPVITDFRLPKRNRQLGKKHTKESAFHDSSFDDMFVMRHSSCNIEALVSNGR